MTHTTVFIYLEGKWRSLGKPWNCYQPSRSEIRDAISRMMKGGMIGAI